MKAGRNFGPSNEGGGERDKLDIVDWRGKKKMRNGVVQVLIVRRDKSTTVFCFGRRPYACPMSIRSDLEIFGKRCSVH